MKSQTEAQKTSEKTKKPRFKIEKLEERIAPGGFKHPGSHAFGEYGGRCNGHHYNAKCRH